MGQGTFGGIIFLIGVILAVVSSFTGSGVSWLSLVAVLLIAIGLVIFWMRPQTVHVKLER